MLKIFPNEWDAAIFLPLAEWEGASEEEVFQDSIRMFNK
jgi:hypothetical protein